MYHYLDVLGNQRKHWDCILRYRPAAYVMRPETEILACGGRQLAFLAL